MKTEIHMGSDAASLSTVRTDDAPKEPLLRWLAINVLRLALYLAVASFVSAIGYGLLQSADLRSGEALFWTSLFFIVGGLLGIPGAVLWLSIVASLPTEWSSGRRRAFALATSPLIQFILLIASMADPNAAAFSLIFGILFPAGAAFVVRLRERMPSSPRPSEDA
jgi:hypothetical protein